MSRHLAINVSSYGASFVRISAAGSIQKHTLVFESVQADEIKKALNHAFETEALLKLDFSEMTVAWSTQKSTLVPNNVFAESSSKAIYNLCFGDSVSEGDIDYNRIAELSVVNVFEIPIWLKSYFVIKFPRVIIQHTGTHALRKAIGSNSFKLKATAVVHDSFFQLTLVKHNNLEFYSFFDAQSAEDVIYHLMFTLQQKEMVNDKGTIELSPGTGGSNLDLKEISSGLEKIKGLSGFKITIEEDFVAKAQQLCV